MVSSDPHRAIKDVHRLSRNHGSHLVLSGIDSLCHKRQPQGGTEFGDDKSHHLIRIPVSPYAVKHLIKVYVDEC